MELHRKISLIALPGLGCAVATATRAQAPQPTAVIIENVRIFSGTDFRLPPELPAAAGSFHFGERMGAAAIADDADAVRKRAREQFALGASQVKLRSKMLRWCPPAEVLKMATAGNAELLALSGPRSPCPGKLGVVPEGALTDLLVDGDPLANINLIDDPAKNFVVT